jgi:hypothetical protein
MFRLVPSGLRAVPSGHCDAAAQGRRNHSPSDPKLIALIDRIFRIDEIHLRIAEDVVFTLREGER